MAARPEPEMVLGPVYGLRAWKVTTDGLVHSMFRSEVWRPGTRCRCTNVFRPPNGHQKWNHPARNCQCGWYSYKVPQLGAPLGIQVEGTLCNREFFGLVALRGRVLEHHGGYRAEYADPVVVFTDGATGMGETLAQIAFAPWPKCEVVRIPPDGWLNVAKRVAMLHDWVATHSGLALLDNQQEVNRGSDRRVHQGD